MFLSPFQQLSTAVFGAMANKAHQKMQLLTYKLASKVE